MHIVRFRYPHFANRVDILLKFDFRKIQRHDIYRSTHKNVAQRRFEVKSLVFVNPFSVTHEITMSRS